MLLPSRVPGGSTSLTSPGTDNSRPDDAQRMGLTLVLQLELDRQILDRSENPFEGLGNDIPIDGLTRTIEIDLREMFGELDPPPPLKAENDIQM